MGQLLKPMPLLLFGIILGTGVGWFAHTENYPTVTPLRQSDLSSNTRYQFIDPLIGLNNSSDSSVSPEYESLQNAVEHFIDSEVVAGRLEKASVNFRDFEVSVGFVINPDEQFAPASLFKVPTMMGYFKLAEKNPELLSRRLLYTGSTYNTKESIQSPVQLIPGKSYSTEELLAHMIKNSDNNAARMLGDYLNTIGSEGVANSLVRDLGITQIEYAQDFITIRAFALFFRVLYNSTYLSRDMSERALDILSQTDFKDGLVAGVASNTPVAHKFGEFSLLNPEHLVLKRELHDCGIIYYPKHPYLLCVMTKGGDFFQLENVISGISRIVYTTVNNKHAE